MSAIMVCKLKKVTDKILARRAAELMKLTPVRDWTGARYPVGAFGYIEGKDIGVHYNVHLCADHDSISLSYDVDERAKLQELCGGPLEDRFNQCYTAAAAEAALRQQGYTTKIDEQADGQLRVHGQAW